MGTKSNKTGTTQRFHLSLSQEDLARLDEIMQIEKRPSRSNMVAALIAMYDKQSEAKS